MTEYHKIDSLYMRDPATKHKTFLPEYARPEFGYLKDNRWCFTEKIDGTNVRVMFTHEYDAPEVRFGGRTDDAQMPVFLMEKLQALFPLPLMHETFPEPGRYVLYGEGYGAKIQKGGGDYIPDGCGFILFDVYASMWLKRESVEDIGAKLAIPVAPIVAYGTLSDAEDLCRYGFGSQLRKSPPEGIVMRPEVELCDRRGERIITKLKLRDFQ